MHYGQSNLNILVLEDYRGNFMRIEEPKKVKGFKIVHTIPDMTEEEREQKKKEILSKLYNYFTYNKKHSTQK